VYLQKGKQIKTKNITAPAISFVHDVMDAIRLTSKRTKKKGQEKGHCASHVMSPADETRNTRSPTCTCKKKIESPVTQEIELTQNKIKIKTEATPVT
jgi:hypothetical protein